MRKQLVVFTGAFDTGKTTILHYLRDTYGYRIHPEAHREVLGELGEQTRGHPPLQP
ncbi:MAG: AAA family ATPase, partial [bacterium]|nr:AAA family ATPase [bacterium]